MTYVLRGTRFYLAKYLSLYFRKYWQTYSQLRTRMRRQLRRSLCLDLDLDLFRKLNLFPNLNLYLSLFRSLLRQLIASSFGSSYESKLEQLWASTRLTLGRPMLPPGRPVGRGVDGRIVVQMAATTTYRRRAIAGHAAPFLGCSTVFCPTQSCSLPSGF